MKNGLISDSLIAVLTSQYAHEVYNSHLYLRIVSFLKSKGLDNIASIFHKQYEEELEHSELIFGFLMDMGVDFVTPAIDSVKEQLSGMISVGEAFLAREILTTQSLEEIREMSKDEDFPVLREFMSEMIKRQQAEYEEATTFLDKVNLLQDDWKFVMLWDASLESE